jgi:hypothetical protein
MKESRQHTFTDFLFELLIYAALVVVYLSLVFHFLGDWLTAVFNENRVLYAGLGLVFMLIQAFALERLTTGLLLTVRRRQK